VKPKEVNVPSYLRHNDVDEEVYYSLRSKIDCLREVLEIKRLPIILEQEDLAAVFKGLVSRLPQGIAYYSGLKRIGYKF
jgi:hypothetical protein